MAQDRGDGGSSPDDNISSKTKRDLREVLRGHELPAQWQNYPLKTQEELMRGRDSLHDHALWLWADEGERWLRTKFPKTFEFHTMANIEERTITLTVYHRPGPNTRAVQVFKATEKAANFVSRHMYTKVVLIAG